MHTACIWNLIIELTIRESADSLCRDGADAQYMQYLSKLTIAIVTETQKRGRRVRYLCVYKLISDLLLQAHCHMMVSDMHVHLARYKE